MIAIAAMSQNRVLGRAGKIPWRLPEDFRWFKRRTMGGILVMGRKTFESIGKPLPGRDTLVITTRPDGAGADDGVSRLSWAGFQPGGYPGREVFLCGGAQIYQLGLPLCSELLLTQVHGEFEGDAFMPPFEHLFPRLEILSEHRDEASGLRFTIERHSR
jgi:dihydrofolate reductase